MIRHRYEPTGAGVLAVEASALGALFAVEPIGGVEARDGVAVVSVRGPLTHHAGVGFLDSYEAIQERVCAALATKPKALVLSLDSPGGEVAGCFEAARSIRAKCSEAGVPLHAYVDGKAGSAAYALACVADTITLPDTGIVGSIGTIDALVDATAIDAATGTRWAVISSGARKADGNPHVAMSEGAIAAAQARVNSLAEVFFGHVASCRSISADQVRALQAAQFVGAEALKVGLADALGTESELVARLSGAAPAAKATAQQITAPEGAANEERMTEDEKARAALKAIADDEKADAKARTRAKAALAAMDGEGEPKPEEKKAEAPPSPPAKDDDEKKEEPDAKAIALQTQAMVLADRREREVQALLATRPDLTEEQRGAFASLDPAALKSVLSATPRNGKKNLAAATVVPFTRGSTTGSGAADQGSPQFMAMQRAMGLVETSYGIDRDENGDPIFGALVAAK